MNSFKKSIRSISFVIMVVDLMLFFPLGDVGAAGYKIPEQSDNAVALSGAYVANASGPDAAYYNPAGMVWSADGAALEGSLNYVRLPKVRFKGSVRDTPADANSKSENFVLPNIHYISPRVGRARFGLSLVYPFGLTRRWDTPLQKLSVEEFTLNTVELDLSAGYEVSKKIAVGGGIRGIYSDGKVKSDTTSVVPGVRLERDLEGDDISAGYFLALAYKPIQNLSFATTYRSKVTPDLEGDAKLSSGIPGIEYDGATQVEVVLPATFQIATAYTYRKAVFEFVYERTYWGAYEALDFEYATALPGPPTLLTAAFDDPIPRDYIDSDTYRFGLTYQYNPKWVLLFGFGIDETPVPEKTLGFELPDSDALIYSTGFKFRPNGKLTFAFAYLFSDKEDRTVTVNEGEIKGTFESSVHVLNASVIYIF